MRCDERRQRTGSDDKQNNRGEKKRHTKTMTCKAGFEDTFDPVTIAGAAGAGATAAVLGDSTPSTATPMFPSPAITDTSERWGCESSSRMHVPAVRCNDALSG